MLEGSCFMKIVSSWLLSVMVSVNIEINCFLYYKFM